MCIHLFAVRAEPLLRHRGQLVIRLIPCGEANLQLRPAEEEHVELLYQRNGVVCPNGNSQVVLIEAVFQVIGAAVDISGINLRPVFLTRAVGQTVKQTRLHAEMQGKQKIKGDTYLPAMQVHVGVVGA